MTRFLQWAVIPVLVALAGASPGLAGVDPTSLPAVGYHPEGLAYWATPYFANALWTGGPWLEYADWEWGEEVSTWQNPQFDANGFPRYLNPGRRLRALLFGLHTDVANRPPTWPRRSTLADGHVVLTWLGDADIRLSNGTWRADESSGPETGRLVDGRRVYVLSGGEHLEWLEVHDINPAAPVTRIRVWLSDPADPQHLSLENQLLHPLLLARLADSDWGFIRFMALADTNGNPQQDWSDRQPPAHCFGSTRRNPRSPAPGVSWVSGNRPTGLAFEHMVAMANASGHDLWINVPHLATDDFVTRLAQLIRYGSDGIEPYTGPVADPVYPPLAAGLRVFVEYSNEIWSGGDSFPQGEWAELRAQALGITKAQYNARRFCDVWRAFQQVFGSTDRLVRVAAVFTAADWYTAPFLAEMASYGPTLSPPQEPDVIACTTYFGNGIQDWAYQRAQAAAGTADPWFLTGETFDPGDGSARPVSVPPDQPYWVGLAVARHLEATFDEWTRRLLSGDAREGGGPDAVGIGGGFDVWLRQLAQTAFPAPKPLIAYEGGPSLYTDYLDGGDPRDDGVTTFMEALNRQPRFAELYAMHLNMAAAKGLRSHVAFTDTSPWGKYGQWGHLESLDQEPRSSPKYAFLLDWAREIGALRHVDDPLGTAPTFVTPHTLPVATWGVRYVASVLAGGGEHGHALKVLGSHLPQGLTVEMLSGDPVGPGERYPEQVALVTGTPSEPGKGYVYLRGQDGDGDPTWRTFTVRVVGGPGTLFESSFEGVSPALAMPWTEVYVLDPALTYSGWSMGAGASPREGDNALFWSVDAPADEADATLALAIADAEYLGVTVQPEPGTSLDLRGGALAFTIRRLDYHAPRRFAVLTSVGGFADGAQVLTSDRFEDGDDHELVAVLPGGAEYADISGPFEVRIYGFAGQWGGHRACLVDAKLQRDVVKVRRRLRQPG